MSSSSSSSRVLYSLALRRAAPTTPSFSSSLSLGYNAQPRRGVAFALSNTPSVLARPSRLFDDSDPFGERAGLAEHAFIETPIRDLDARRIADKLDNSVSVNENIFGPNDLQNAYERIRRAVYEVREENAKKHSSNNGQRRGDNNNDSNNDKLKGNAADDDTCTGTTFSNKNDALPSEEAFAQLTPEEQFAAVASHLSPSERRFAESLPDGGLARYFRLSPAEREAMYRDFALSERANARRSAWERKSYASYEAYVRSEVVGVTAEDVNGLGAQQAGGADTGAADCLVGGRGEGGQPTSSSSTAAAANEDAGEEPLFEDDEADALAALDPLAPVPLPNLGTAGRGARPQGAEGGYDIAPTATADEAIESADAIRHEIEAMGAEAAAAEAAMLSNAGGSDTDSSIGGGSGEREGAPYKLPSTDPSKWGTEDVIAWLDCFADEGVMDDHMKDVFRMAKVDGDMLLNKVMPPNLFKIMRKWHLHRSNPKTRHLAEELVVDTEVVQYTIYLCFPYCGQFS